MRHRRAATLALAIGLTVASPASAQTPEERAAAEAKFEEAKLLMAGG